MCWAYLVRSAIVFSPCAAIEVTVGLQQTMYSVRESDSVQLVCTTVMSGSVAGRTITIHYETTDGEATGE